MIDHVIVAFVAVVTALFICAAAPSIDSNKIDYNNLRGAAKFQAVEAVKP